MQTKKIQQGLCNKQASYMLGVLKRKLHRLYSRLKWLTWKRPRPKVIIKRFGKASSSRGQPQEKISTQNSSRHLNSDPKKPIRIATFNVAMFSLAPAIQKDDFSNGKEDYAVRKSPAQINVQASTANNYPKSILKQSPLHSSLGSPEDLSAQKKHSKSKLKVSINLPDNEISLAHTKFLSIVKDEKESSSNMTTGRNVLMRSPVCLPSSLLNWWDEESFKSSRSVTEILREVDADILALQDVKAEEEKGMKPLSDLAAALGMKYVFAESWAPEYGNAVLSKWPIKRWKVQKIADDDDFRNVLKATIDVPWAGEVNFYCTQLDHLDEIWRMKQVSAIIQSNDSPHVLLGGLNSLNGSDYSLDRWKDIIKYYEDIGKPTPRVEIMKFLKGRGYTDAKNFAGECEPVVIIAKGQNVQGTCKYGTRVDYILGSPDSPYKFIPGSYSVISSKGTSDHHIVKVDIAKVGETSQKDYNKPHLKAKQRVVRVINNSCSSRGIWKMST